MNRPTFRAVLFVFCLIFPVSSFAQSASRSPLTPAPLRGVVPLSLRQAVQLALEYNPDLMVERVKLEQTRAAIQEEKGSLDPVFSISSLLRRNENVVASRFFPTGEYMEKDRIYSAKVNGKVESGGKYGVTFAFHQQESTSNTQTLSPQYQGNLVFAFTQPLLRDYGLGVNRSRLRVAEKARDISEEGLNQAVSRIVYQVVQAYWNVVFLKQELDVKKRSLDVAKTLVANNETLFSAGRVAYTNVYESKAEAAGREQDVTLFQNEIAKAEDFLKLLLHADMSSVTLVPQERLEYSPMALDPQRSNETALSMRPEITRLQRMLEQKTYETQYAVNQLRPRLDLDMQFGMTGLSGRPNQTPLNPLNPELGRVGDNLAGSVLADWTGPGDVFSRFFSRNGFYNYQAEIRLEIPIGNRVAEARLSEAELRKRETEATLASARDGVLLQVRDAMREINAARSGIQAAKVASESSQAQFSAMRVRFDAGFATNYEVLHVVDDLDKNRTLELKAMLEHNIAQSALKLAEGSILSDYDVEIQSRPRTTGGSR